MMAVMAANAPGTPTNFGDYLRFLRRRARLTQTELSIAVGYSPGQISMLENGQRQPNPSTIAALFIAALGIEKDPQASRQLLALAEATAPQPRTSLQQTETEVVVEQLILRQQEEIGFLEDIPPLPAYHVPRSVQLAQIRSWFGREQAVAICGMAGMGKSTLAAHFAHEFAQRHPVFWITLDESLTHGTEALLRQIALFVAANSGTSNHAAPFLHRFAANEPAISYHQQLHMVAAGLAELDRPLLVFDDAHRLDENEQALAMVRRLMTLVPTCRLLLVSRQVIDLPAILHLTLNGLERGEAERLLQKFAASKQPTVDTLLRKTGGNPMLLRLAMSQPAAHPVDSANNELPFARYLVESVLATLDPSARRLLDFLALWRGQLDLKQPHLAMRLEEQSPKYEHQKAISSLQRSRLIDNLNYATPHPLLHEPLLAELAIQPKRRMQLHRIAASQAAHLGQHWEAAYHLAQAGELQEACELITRQEVENLRLGEGVAIAATVDTILQITRSQQSQMDSTTRHDLLRRLLILRGDLLINTTQAEQAHACYNEALTFTTRNIDRARIAEKMAVGAYRQGELQEALHFCEQALDMLGATLSQDAIRLRIQIETIHLQVFIRLTRFEEVRKICERAIALVRPVALILPHLADTVRANANLALGYIASFEGNRELTRQYYTKSVKYARAAQATSVEADALSYLSATLRDLGDFANAELTGQQALDLAHGAGNEYLVSKILHYLSLADYYHADLERSYLRTQQVLKIKQPMGDIEGMVASRLVQSLVLAEQGHIDAALECAMLAKEECGLLENSWLRGLADFSIGVVLSFTDDLAGAEHHVQSALATQLLKLDRPFYSGAEVYMGMIYLAQGRLDEAAEVIERRLATGAGFSAELLQQLVRAMWLLARNEGERARDCATQLIQKAQDCGYLVYALEAQRLLTLIADPPPLHQLPRQVCCESVV